MTAAEPGVAALSAAGGTRAWRSEPSVVAGLLLLVPVLLLLALFFVVSIVRIVGRQPAAGEVVIRADLDEAARVTISQELTLGFTSDDAVAGRV
jgi:hypothetical protein